MAATWSGHAAEEPAMPPPDTPLALLHNILFAFDHRLCFDDASYQSNFIHRLFGGTPQVDSDPQHPHSAATGGDGGRCGDGGLCATSLRLRQGIRPDGTEYAGLAVFMTPGNGITTAVLRDLLGVEGRRLVTVPNPHRIGTYEEREYVLGPDRVIKVEYGPDADLAVLSWQQTK